jgi:peptidoglycan L-alanyl-D-glutamate endopeptidase CwlK
MDVLVVERRLSRLIRPVRQMAERFLRLCEGNGVTVVVTETLRSFERQAYLYRAGRSTEAIKAQAEALRRQGKTRFADILLDVPPNPSNQVVTWTLTSPHLAGVAFDIVVVRDGKPYWSPKDSSEDEQEQFRNTWRRVGEWGESVGLEWGGRWRKPDMPHFQHRGWNRISNNVFSILAVRNVSPEEIEKMLA